LRFLNTEAAASAMIRRFGLDVCWYEFSFGLIGSPHRAFIMKEMERRLEAPDQPVSDGYLHTLSHIAAASQQKEQLPSPGERPGDEQQGKAAIEAWRKRGDSKQKLQIQYTERLISALPRKQGKARAISLHTSLERVWNNSRQSRPVLNLVNLSGPTGGYQSEMIKKLAPEIIAAFDDLPVRIQTGLLGYRWNQLAAPAMLPVLRRIINEKPANDRSNEVRDLKSLALRRLYELAPDEGRKLIIEELRRPDPSVNSATLRLLADETLPELDETLVENLQRADPFVLSELIERYATASALARVRAFYGNKVGQRGCSYQSSLLAYFLRVDPAMGIELVKQELGARGPEYTHCYASLLVDVAKLRTTPELEALAIEHLDDPDPEVVVNAASMLGQYGEPEAEEPLWQRLEKWLQDWKGRGEQLPRNFDSSHPNFWHQQVGRALRKALSQSPAWLLDREKLGKLRQSILDKDELEQFDHQVGDLSGAIGITFHPRDDGWGTALVAHYPCHSFSALKMKLGQFPKNTAFIWNSSAQDRPEAERIYSDLKTFLESRGMKLEKRKAQ
jgi:HEAT repeat protein